MGPNGQNMEIYTKLKCIWKAKNLLVLGRRELAVCVFELLVASACNCPAQNHKTGLAGIIQNEPLNYYL